MSSRPPGTPQRLPSSGTSRGTVRRLVRGACGCVLTLAAVHGRAVEVGSVRASTDEQPDATAAANDSSEAPPVASNAPEPTLEQVEAYLDSHALPKSPEQGGGDQGTYEEVPPPPPRHHGLVVEASPGAFFPLGAMRHISPPSPWLQVDVGYELWTWLLVLAHADFTVASTSYAAEPPPPRTFAQYAFGAGARFQVPLSDWLAAHAQLELGLSEVTEDVLAGYGFADADELGLYYGGRLGLDWLQANPHLAVGAHATLRDYTNLERTNYGDAPLALIGALTLRYAF